LARVAQGLQLVPQVAVLLLLTQAPLQSWVPELQDQRHTAPPDVSQRGVALPGAVHMSPQPEQSSTVFSGVSQPVLNRPSQSSKSPMQAAI
jgi:hypothetical protein